MFTGIVIEKAKVKQISKNENGTVFVISSNIATKGKRIGQSISVNGACMTITEIFDGSFSFLAMPESISRTNLGQLSEGDVVNLEPSLTLDQGIDGHLVQGHIDTMGEVESSDKNILTINFPSEIAIFLAFKGSITVNGVSLTISNLLESKFQVDLTPTTLQKTNLGELKQGDKVNLEIDMIARYLRRLLDSKENETKYEFLKERNLI